MEASLPKKLEWLTIVMMALLYHKEVNLNLWVNKSKQEIVILRICALPFQLLFKSVRIDDADRNTACM